MCVTIMLKDGTAIETVREFEVFFNENADEWRDSNYHDLNRDSCLCQLDLDAFMLGKEGRFAFERGEWLEIIGPEQLTSLLKVRAWDVDHEAYAEMDSIYTRVKFNKDGSFRVFDSRGINDCIIEFSIGMKDQTGREVFQGDIVHEGGPHDNGTNWKVVWEDCGFMFVHANDEGDKYGVYKCYPYRAKGITVVGNIHEGIKKAAK